MKIPALVKFADSANTRQTVKAFYDDRYKLLAIIPHQFQDR
jgi:hypothetical protein